MLSERALTRRLKRHLLKEPQRFMASGALNLEDVLVREVQELGGASELKQVPGGVEFSGPLELMYQANLRLRTAHRLLLRVDSFLAQSYPMLYNKVKRLPWELYLGFSPSLRISVSAKTSRVRHEGKVAETIHQAILAALTPHGFAPLLQDDAPVTLYARFSQDRCTLSLDTSGMHLHRRGYRQATAKAPLRETLAAALLRLVGWQDYDLILDPMCGSGTLAIEASLLEQRIAPGLERSFAFEALPFFQESKWERFKLEAAAEVRPPAHRIVAGDLNQGALRAAEGNASRAGVLDGFTLLHADARRLDFTSLREGLGSSLLITNPPYGQRIGDDAAVRALYRAFGRRLKECAPGWTVAIVCPNELAGALELELNPVRQFLNGGLRVGLYLGTI